jgi:hypothetical protein
MTLLACIGIVHDHHNSLVDRTEPDPSNQGNDILVSTPIAITVVVILVGIAVSIIVTIAISIAVVNMVVINIGSLLSSPSEGAGRSGRAASKLARSTHSLPCLQWRCHLRFNFALMMVGVKPATLGGLVGSANQLQIGVWGAEVAIAVQYSSRVNKGWLQEVDNGWQRD